MKKRLLAFLLTAVVILTMAISSFAVVPKEQPLLKQAYPDDIQIYPSNAYQGYKNEDVSLWEPHLCDICGNTVLKLNIFDIEEHSISGSMYVDYWKYNGFYAISNYDYPLTHGIIAELEYSWQGDWWKVNGSKSCAYNEHSKNYQTYLDLSSDEEGNAFIVSHANLYFTNDDIDVYYGNISNPVVMFIPKYNKDPYLENGQKTSVYSECEYNFNKYIHENRSTNYKVYSKLAYNTINVSVYDDTVFDKYYSNGYGEGYELGLVDGKKEGFNLGYESGENVGRLVGFDLGKKEASIDSYNEGFQNGYKEGEIEGQETNEALDVVFDGIFRGISGFFAPFLSLGIGNLTVGSLLGLWLTVIVIMLILKIVRG